MDAITGIPAIDVAIGLMFLFFLLSVVCSQVNELVASKLNLRGKNLRQGIESLLGDRAGPVMAGPFVDAVKRQGWWRRLLRKPLNGARPPSYLGPRTFALAVVHDLAAPDRPALAGITETLANLDDDHPAKAPLLRFVAEAGGELDQFKKSVETWFDDAMDRVSGWYRRRAQTWLLVYAAVVTVALNVDTILVARTLWRDDALRGAVVARAEAVLEEAEASTDQPEGSPGAATTTDDGDAAAAALEGTLQTIKEEEALGLPLGWPDDSEDPRAWPGWWTGEMGVRVAGWFLTVAALSLGAPFWFDFLGKVSRVRQTGIRPSDEPQPAKGRARPG